MVAVRTCWQAPPTDRSVSLRKAFALSPEPCAIAEMPSIALARLPPSLLSLSKTSTCICGLAWRASSAADSQASPPPTIVSVGRWAAAGGRKGERIASMWRSAATEGSHTSDTRASSPPCAATIDGIQALLNLWYS
jgi:hypothetical protein